MAAVVVLMAGVISLTAGDSTLNGSQPSSEFQHSSGSGLESDQAKLSPTQRRRLGKMNHDGAPLPKTGFGCGDFGNTGDGAAAGTGVLADID
jgi:hypothetical protein